MILFRCLVLMEDGWSSCLVLMEVPFTNKKKKKTLALENDSNGTISVGLN